ncbi:hypothetical protein B0H13DRAFT_1904916 [Mycena leptocephala]|nr:hypothetical protein B0H13DRAFT_1904916 [Mycena leptocephala]
MHRSPAAWLEYAQGPHSFDTRGRPPETGTRGRGPRLTRTHTRTRCAARRTIHECCILVKERADPPGAYWAPNALSLLKLRESRESTRAKGREGWSGGKGGKRGSTRPDPQDSGPKKTDETHLAAVLLAVPHFRAKRAEESRGTSFERRGLLSGGATGPHNQGVEIFEEWTLWLDILQSSEVTGAVVYKACDNLQIQSWQRRTSRYLPSGLQALYVSTNTVLVAVENGNFSVRLYTMITAISPSSLAACAKSPS